MGQLSDQLKEYLDNTSPEQQEKDWFNIGERSLAKYLKLAICF